MAAFMHTCQVNSAPSLTSHFTTSRFPSLAANAHQSRPIKRRMVSFENSGPIGEDITISW